MNNDFAGEFDRTKARKSRRRPGKAGETGRYMDDVFAGGRNSGSWSVNSSEGRSRSGEQPPGGAGSSPQAGSVEPGSRAARLSGGGNSGGSGGRSPGGSRPPSQEPKQPSSRAASRAARARKRRRLIILAVAECIALVFIFSYAYVARKLSVIQHPEFEEKNVANIELTPAKKEHMKGYWTIAVFGVDSRGNNVSKGTNADVSMVCNINMDTGEIKIVSVFRDTYLNINDKGIYHKINQAYAQGGPEQAVKAMNKNLDLNITDYITFNWKAVADAINILGGVDVDISQAEFHYINSFITETVRYTKIGSNQLKKAGPNHLDGVQAVAYGRLRLMDTDYARTERQRKIISLAFEKAKKANYSVLNNILVSVLPQVATSLNFEDLTNVALNISKYYLGETGGFPWARGSMIMGGKGDCVIPQTLESNVVKLHEFLFGKENYEPTDMVKKISAKIAADSGMYKEGVAIDHVPTDGGYIPKATTSKTREDEYEESGESGQESGESDVRPGGDASGWEEWPTDEEGNPYDPAWGPDGIRPTAGATGPGESSSGATRPGESSSGATRPGESSSGAVRPGETGPTTPGGTRPGETGPSETEPESTTPGGTGLGPMETKPSETQEERPGPSDEGGPGAQQTTAANQNNSGRPSEAETSAAPPGGDTTPTVAPPPISSGADSQDGGSGQNSPGN